MYLAVVYLLFCIACVVLAFRRHPIYAFYFYLSTTFVYPQGRYWGHAFAEVRPALLAAIVTTLAIVLHMGRLRPIRADVMRTPGSRRRVRRTGGRRRSGAGRQGGSEPDPEAGSTAARR